MKFQAMASAVGVVPGIHGGFRTGFQSSAGGLEQQGGAGFTRSIQHVQQVLLRKDENHPRQFR